MRYGNCLIGLAWIMLKHRFKGHIVIKLPGRRRLVPHFLFRTYDGRFHEYRRVKDVLPWPLCYILFRGEFNVREFKLAQHEVQGCLCMMLKPGALEEE